MLKERKNLLEGVAFDAIEDIGFARAISEGIKSSSVSETELFKALDEVK